MPHISIRTMTTADIPFGIQLQTSAGWNQLEADWRRVLDLAPTGCFVGMLEGTPVGTVASTRFGNVAWISMMLVSAVARGQGVGKALMTAALDHLEKAGVATIRLDATPLGRPLYEKLGFELEFEGARFAGVPHVAVDKSEDEVSPLTLVQLNLAAKLDRQITGTDRSLLLRRLFADENEQAWCVQQGERLLGFQMKRRGAKATHIGPCMARDTTGSVLLKAALCRHSQENVYVDVPLQNLAACQLLRAAGLESQRPLYRMTRGPRIAEQPVHIWASFGPEKG